MMSSLRFECIVPISKSCDIYCKRCYIKHWMTSSRNMLVGWFLVVAYGLFKDGGDVNWLWMMYIWLTIWITDFKIKDRFVRLWVPLDTGRSIPRFLGGGGNGHLVFRWYLWHEEHRVMVSMQRLIAWPTWRQGTNFTQRLRNTRQSSQTMTAIEMTRTVPHNATFWRLLRKSCENWAENDWENNVLMASCRAIFGHKWTNVWPVVNH